MGTYDEVFVEQLRADVRFWVERGRPVELLYRDDRLEMAREWARQNAISREEWDFVEAGALAEQAQAVATFLKSIVEDLIRMQISIRGYVRLLLADAFGPLTDQQAQFMTRVVQLAEQLTWRHRDLLNYRAYLLGHIPTFVAPVSIEKVLDKASETLSTLFSTEQLHLSREVVPDLPEIYADQNQMHDALVRIFSILTYAGGNISTRLARQDEEVQVELTATKVALPDGPIGRLFAEEIHPQHRLHFNLLYLKRLIAIQGGRMWVEDNPNGSLTIGFTLRTQPLKALSKP